MDSVARLLVVVVLHWCGKIVVVDSVARLLVVVVLHCCGKIVVGGGMAGNMTVLQTELENQHEKRS